MDIKYTTRKRSLLLYLAGPDVEKIFETIPDNGKEKDYVAAAKLTEYFAPKKNIMYEIHLLRKAQQHQGETIDQFYTRLCQFADEKHEIKIQLIERCSSTRVRRKALPEEAITLDGLLKYGRSLEVCELQAGELEKTNEHSDSINAFNKNTDRFKKSHHPSNKIKTEQGCFYCGVYTYSLVARHCVLSLERNVRGVAAWVILRRCVELNTRVRLVHLAVTEEI